MHLRLAQPDDLPELSRIYAASWKYAYRGMMPQAYLDRLPEDFWVPSFSQRLEQGIYTITVAEQQNTLCGGVIYAPREKRHWKTGGKSVPFMCSPPTWARARDTFCWNMRC